MIFFKNKFAKILLLLLIEFKIDTLLPSVTVKLRCERWGGGGSRIEDRGSGFLLDRLFLLQIGGGHRFLVASRRRET